MKSQFVESCHWQSPFKIQTEPPAAPDRAAFKLIADDGRQTRRHRWLRALLKLGLNSDSEENRMTIAPEMFYEIPKLSHFLSEP